MKRTETTRIAAASSVFAIAGASVAARAEGSIPKLAV